MPVFSLHSNNDNAPKIQMEGNILTKSKSASVHLSFIGNNDSENRKTITIICIKADNLLYVVLSKTILIVYCDVQILIQNLIK